MNKKNNLAVTILAAGQGKRMQSDLPKVLHVISGEPLILRTLKILNNLEIDQKIVVVGYKGDEVKKALKNQKVGFAQQKLQLGTADALRSALKIVDAQIENVLVLNGDDSSFYKPQTIKKLVEIHNKNNNTLTFLTVNLSNPTGLGRVLRKNGQPAAVIEEKDATEKQRTIGEINCGLYIFKRAWLEANIASIKKSQTTGEYYLPNLVAIAALQNQKIAGVKLKDPAEWIGINTPWELEAAKTKADASIQILHFMGVGGAGESAVASLAQKFGYKISGCDITPNSPYIKNLKLKIAKNHNKNHLKGITKLIISPAISLLNNKNPELLFARKNQIPVLTWQEFQGKFLQRGKFLIAVAGGYGKSTTTAMISKILEDAGLEPTCVVGAKLIDWQTNWRFGNSKYYVCEADEYNNNFLNYRPDIALILNVAWDHPDFFKTKSNLINSYKKFIGNINKNGILVIGPDKDLQKLASSTRKDIKVIRVKDFGKTDLSIIGSFRKENSNAALTVAQFLNIDPAKSKKSVEEFRGLERRLEYKGKIGNCQFYDDYAVQPYTILKTANALRDKFPDSRIALVFEPHTFTRIEAFFREFINSLNDAKVDAILITDIFAAREVGDKSELPVKIEKALGGKCRYTGSIEESAGFIRKNLSKYDIVLSMGAGNVFKIYDLLNLR